jgi:hypothetical protein
LRLFHQPPHRDLRRVGDEQVHMIILTVALHQTRAEVGADIGEDLTEQVEMGTGQHSAPILGHEDQV